MKIVQIERLKFREYAMSKEKKQLSSLTRVLSIAPESIDEENRTVEVVWTTGARAIQWNWDLGGEFVEELEISEKAINMERLGSGSAPFLNMHDGWSLSSILGVVERAWIVDGKEGRAVIRFPKDDENIDKVWNLVKQRIICNISVGYTVEEYEKYEEDGKFIYRAIKWTPLELSAVTVPADPKANVRASEGRTNACVITTRSTKTKEKNMKRSKREEDIQDEEDLENGTREDEDIDNADDPEDENRSDCQDEDENRENEEDKEARKRKNYGAISRREYILDLCEVANVSLKEARQFMNSKLSISEIRSKILAKRSGNAAKISNSGSQNTQKTKTLSQRASEVYLKKGM